MDVCDTYVIRRVNPDDDLELLGQIVLQSYVALPDSPVEPDYERELLDIANRVAVAEVFGAFDGGRPLGCVTFVPHARAPLAENLRDDESSFRMMAVDPAARGRGIGESLVVRCLDAARAVGSSAVFIHSGTWMHAAHRIYDRLGFERVPERDWRFGDPPFTLLGFRCAVQTGASGGGDQ